MKPFLLDKSSKVTVSTNKNTFQKGYIISLKEESHLCNKVLIDFDNWCSTTIEMILVERPNRCLNNMHFPIAWHTKLMGIQYYIGCGDSHRLCWQRIAMSTKPGFYLVLESDVQIDFDNAPKLGSVEKLLENFVPDDAGKKSLNSK